MLRKLLNRLSKRAPEFKGIHGIIERCTRKQVMGWLVTSPCDNPEPQNFIVMYQGKNWVERVELWHRPGLSDYKKDNLYGFRLFLKPRLRDTAEASVLYCLGRDFYTIPSMPEREIELAGVKSEAHFYNLVFANALLQNISIQQPELIAESLKTGKHHELSDSVSEFLLPAGIKSHYETAITGKDGHLFLYGGSNKVDKLFDHDAQLNEDLAEKWRAIIAKRFTQLEQYDCQLLQMVIPEKQSVIPGSYYREINGASPLLRHLEAQQLPGWFSVLEALSDDVSKDYFFKTDSHLNSHGCWRVFEAILEHLELAPVSQPEFNRLRTMCGDLGKKFAPYKLSEHDVSPSRFPVTSSKPELVTSFIPPDKRHIGRTYHWRNNIPVSEKRVLVFGNSFFEKGINAHQLTWWFAHYFAEVIFIWSPDMNIGMVKKHKPDLVICQSIERFARLAPSY
ncbi:MAG: hypothetical protein GYB58_12135 [Gammaproteobacteria bacterium]|nr:hypothetical protein [Gammaproteobacteria bacterium]